MLMKLGNNKSKNFHNLSALQDENDDGESVSKRKKTECSKTRVSLGKTTLYSLIFQNFSVYSLN